jgi:ankyrin repeat protein
LACLLLDKGADPNQYANGFTALDEAIMWRNETEVKALLDHHADANLPLKTWTPTRRSSDDYHFDPSLVGATPFWLAARLDEPNVMQMLVQHGADPKFVLDASYVVEAGFAAAVRKERTTTLLAAVGIGGNATSWTPVSRSERPALTLEAVKLIVDLGVVVNASNTDGSTALDGAKALGYQPVVDLLVSKGAKPGSGSIKRSRSRDAGSPGAEPK